MYERPTISPSTRVEIEIEASCAIDDNASPLYPYVAKRAKSSAHASFEVAWGASTRSISRLDMPVPLSTTVIVSLATVTLTEVALASSAFLGQGAVLDELLDDIAYARDDLAALDAVAGARIQH